jgi:hypothetical protein
MTIATMMTQHPYSFPVDQTKFGGKEVGKVIVVMSVIHPCCNFCFPSRALWSQLIAQLRGGNYEARCFVAHIRNSRGACRIADASADTFI